MTFRARVEADLAKILEGRDGWDITLISPVGATFNVRGTSQDVYQMIDPSTGIVVSGRRAGVVIRVSTLYAAGITEIPRASSRGPSWRVVFNDINGRAHTFKIAESNPDRTTGVLALQLEGYDNA